MDFSASSQTCFSQSYCKKTIEEIWEVNQSKTFQQRWQYISMLQLWLWLDNISPGAYMCITGGIPPPTPTPDLGLHIHRLCDKCTTSAVLIRDRLFRGMCRDVDKRSSRRAASHRMHTNPVYTMNLTILQDCVTEKVAVAWPSLRQTSFRHTWRFTVTYCKTSLPVIMSPVRRYTCVMFVTRLSFLQLLTLINLIYCWFFLSWG